MNQTKEIVHDNFQVAECAVDLIAEASAHYTLSVAQKAGNPAIFAHQPLGSAH